MIYFKHHSFLKYLISIYIFLTICSLFYIFSINNLINISLLYERLFSIGYGYWIAISFIIVQIGIGRILFRLPFLRNLKLSGLAYLMFSLGGGFYVSYCILMILALLNWLNGPGIVVFILFAIPSIFFGYRSIREITLYYHKKISSSSNKNLIKKKLFIISILIIIWIIPYFIQTFHPNTDWDGASFHLPQAKRFLEGKITSVDASYPSYNQPGAIHLVYSLFFAVRAESAIIPLNFLIALAIIITVYSLASKIWNKKAALWAAAICAAVNLLFEVALTPRIDAFLTFYFVLAVYSFLLWIQNKKNSSIIIVTGMMLGITLGIKSTSIFFVIVLVPIIFILTIKKLKSNFKVVITNLLLSILCLSIPSIWWYARNTLYLGDPIYPFLAGPVYYDTEGNRQSFNPSLEKIGEKMPNKDEVISTILGQHKLNFLYTENRQNKQPKHLFNLLDILKNPEKYQRNPYHEINLFILLFFLLPLFSRKKQSLWLYGISLAIYIIIGSQTFLLRYALPVFPLFSIGAGIVLSHIRLKRLLIVLTIGLCLNFIYFNYFEWIKISSMQAESYLTGKKSRIEWLLSVGYNLRLTDTPLFIKFINESVDNGYIDKDDTLFMIGECKGNLLKCNYIPDIISNRRNRWLEELMKVETNYMRLAKEFKIRGIRFLVLNEAFYQVIVPKSLFLERGPLIYSLYHLYRFLKKYTTIIYDKRGIIVAKIV